MAQLDLIATMAFGLESVVAEELATLGYKTKTLGNGRVLFRADELAIARANLWLRAADRVLLRLGMFPATDFGQLFDGVYQLPWEAWLPADAAFPVKGRSVKSQLSSVPACQKIVKKAIVEKLRAAHRVATLSETGAQFTIEVALLNDQATLTLDTTGPGLNKRGYRTLLGEAQLKETLAAAMLQLCRWQPEQPLIDPFCDTGTIPIEAALMGRHLAPGRNRAFAAEHWPAMAGQHWIEARAEARDAAKPELPERIVASDLDEAALRQARFHAQQAGVEADVHFQPREFTDVSSSKRHGLLLCNPPYGERLSSQHEAELLYRTMPAVFSRLPTWSFGVLTSHERLDRLVGRRSASRRKLYNGRIECWLYQFVGPQPRGAEQPPLFVDSDPRAIERYRRLTTSASAAAEDAGDNASHGQQDSAPAARQLEMFANRLTKVARHLRKWPQRGVTCYRLYERDIPEIPLVIDRYADCLHIVERPRPHDRTLNEHHRWLDNVVATASTVLGIPPESVFLKRYSDRPELLETAETAEPTHQVQEDGLFFGVHLRDFRDTGLALDLRLVRATIRKLAVAKRVLCLWANTGTMAVAAAAGGAISTLSLDPGSLTAWARRNLMLNGFTEPGHRAERAAVTEWLGAVSGQTFDLMTIEDPTPAEVRGVPTASDFQHGHTAILQALPQLLAPGGAAYLISHDRRFRLDAQALHDWRTREITAQTVPEDYRNERIHRVWRIVRTTS